MPSRSPVLFWLLLAATLIANVFSVRWIYRDGLEEKSATVFLALAVAQLSTLCVWVVWDPKRVGFGWIVPFFVGGIFALVLALTEPSGPHEAEWDAMLAFTGIMRIHVALTLSLLWLLKPTKLCATFSGRETKPRWQFSTLHLLIVMTMLAILCAILARAELLAEEVAPVTTLPVANAMLLVAVIAAVQFKLHWLLRLAAAIWCALAIAVVCEWTQLAFADELNFFVYSLIQAFVLWAWLELIRPSPEAATVLATADVAAEPPAPLEE